MGLFKNLFKERTKDWVFKYLNPTQTPDNSPVQSIATDSMYVTVWLKSARIVNVREFVSKYYGVVHCQSALAVPGQTDKASFHFVRTPGELVSEDAKNVDRVIQMNKEVLGPIPYTGGSLEIDAGLFSIKSVDLLKPYLDVITELSTLAGVSYVQVAKPFLGPIQKGLAMLFGGGSDKVLEIGFSSSFEPVQTGYFVVVRAERNEVDIAKLVVSKDDYRLLDAGGKPIQDYPYMVFQITASTKRDDYFRIPEIKDAYENLRATIRNGKKLSEAQDALAFFRRTVLTSYDLLSTHADEIVEKAEEMVKKLYGPKVHAVAAETREIPNLEDLPVSFRII